MRSTALAYKDEYDEVPVSSTEVLEANVVAIRADLNELKTDFRAAVARIDQNIAAAVSKLEAEIRALATKAGDDIRQLAQDMREMRAEDKSLRDRIDKGHETINSKTDKNYETLSAKIDSVDQKLSAKIDATDEKLSGKIDATDQKLSAKIDATNRELTELGRIVTKIGSRMNALLWVMSGLGALITLAITIAKAFDTKGSWSCVFW